MRFLIGNFQHNIDAKGRISIPQRFREIFGAVEKPPVTIFEGFEGCLFCYPSGVFESILDRLTQQEFDSRKVRILRRISRHGSVVDMDGQGRIQLSEGQRAVAGLTRECLVLGAGTRVELWSPARFEDRESLGDAGELVEGVLRDIDVAMRDGRDRGDHR